MNKHPELGVLEPGGNILLLIPAPYFFWGPCVHETRRRQIKRKSIFTALKDRNFIELPSQRPSLDEPAAVSLDYLIQLFLHPDGDIRMFVDHILRLCRIILQVKQEKGLFKGFS
jgi:hypothetical protein